MLRAKCGNLGLLPQTAHHASLSFKKSRRGSSTSRSNSSLWGVMRSRASMTPTASLRPLRNTATYRRAVNELFLTWAVRGFLERFCWSLFLSWLLSMRMVRENRFRGPPLLFGGVPTRTGWLLRHSTRQMHRRACPRTGLAAPRFPSDSACRFRPVCLRAFASRQADIAFRIDRRTLFRYFDLLLGQIEAKAADGLRFPHNIRERDGRKLEESM